MVERYVKTDGENPFRAPQSMGGNPLKDLPLPASPTDAANKEYVDAHGGGSSSTPAVIFHLVEGEQGEEGPMGPPGAVSFPFSQITNANSIQTVSVLAELTGIAITPPAGTYLVWFSGRFFNGTATTNITFIAISVNGVGVNTTGRNLQLTGSVNDDKPVTIIGRVTVNGSQPISAVAFVNAGSVSAIERSLMVLRVG